MFAFLMVVKEAKEDTAIFAKHKGMGKIIRSKIARDKTINVDPSVSMYEESLRVQESKYCQFRNRFI